MTIHVTPEPDGSYTVSCGSETITVGGPRPAAPAGGRGGVIRWPDDPEGNPNGVRAYLAVGQPAPGLLQGILGVFQSGQTADQSGLTADSLESTDEISAHVQHQLLGRAASESGEPLHVHVAVEPGRSIDIESVMNRVKGVAQSKGTRIVLHIEVGAARVAGSGI